MSRRKPNNPRARLERSCRAILSSNHVAVVSISPSGWQGMVNWKLAKRIPPGRQVANALCDGVLGAKRGLDLKSVCPDDREAVATLFGIAPAMAAEIVFENDDRFGNYEPQPDGTNKYVRETPERRWQRMRKWVEENIVQVAP